MSEESVERAAITRMMMQHLGTDTCTCTSENDYTCEAHDLADSVLALLATVPSDRRRRPRLIGLRPSPQRRAPDGDGPGPGGAMTILVEALFSGEAGRWVRATEESRVAESDFEDFLATILPDREFDELTYDLVDWDGISLEFTGYIGDPPTDVERERIFALGFTVIRIDYKEPRRNTTQFKFHGDWSCVKGDEPRVGRPR